jgi:microcystin-dependent protein
MPLLTVDATGNIKTFAPGVTTVGYLPCDGSQYPQTQYPSLFAVIGTTFNLGTETAGNFRVPNMQGKVKLGAGQDATRGLSARTLGEFLGEENHSLATAEMPPHTHSGYTDYNSTDNHYHNGNSVSDNLNLNHTHSYTAINTHGAGSGGGNAGANASGQNTTGAYNISLVHDHGVSITSLANTHTNNSYTTDTGTGVAGDPHNNMQPSLGIPYYIKY